jgi:predicted ATPase
MPRKYVLTGGPKTGKTTVIKILKKMGYQIVHEAATTLINEALENDEPPPWQDMQNFQKNIFKLQLKREQMIDEYPSAIFDRSIIDSIGYTRFYNIACDKQAIEYIKKEPYAGVFLLDFFAPFSPDKTRVEDFDLANTLHLMLQKTYEDFGYTPIMVPALSAEQRAVFICENIKKLECINSCCFCSSSLYVPRF